MVENKWQNLTKVACSFLADAHLPKKFWYWVLCKANVRSNIFPVSQKADNIANPDYLTTTYYELFGEKPNYRILFPFGAIGAFCCVRDRNNHFHKFNLQCLFGIALGYSEFTNHMVFCNSTRDSFCTSADYLIDKNCHIWNVFPSIRYDGRLVTLVILNENDGPSKFDIDKSVFVHCQDTFDIFPATITIPPTSQTKCYTIKLDDGTQMDVLLKDIYTEDTAPASGKPSISMGFFFPEWLKRDQKVTLLQNDVYKQGLLDFNDHNLWEFITRDIDSNITSRADLLDLQYTWKMRM